MLKAGCTEREYLAAWRSEIDHALECGALTRENNRATLRTAVMTPEDHQSFKEKNSKP